METPRHVEHVTQEPNTWKRHDTWNMSHKSLTYMETPRRVEHVTQEPNIMETSRHVEYVAQEPNIRGNVMTRGTFHTRA
jgi:hypothetical protein